MKRFVFELINRFFHLFYIAFVEQDILTTKTLLAKLFLLDEVRRVGVESILPLITKKSLDFKKEKFREDLQKKCDVSEEVVECVMQINLWEYDDFDDYIEVIF